MRRKLLALALFTCAAVAVAVVVPLQRVNTAAHPLDALASSEIEAAAQIVRQHRSAPRDLSFTFIALQEPDKQAFLSANGADLGRRAEVGIYSRKQNRLYEVVVDLRTRKVITWRHIPGAQPIYLADDDKVLREILAKDTAWQAALISRGLRDDDSISVTGLSIGNEGQSKAPGARMLMALVSMNPVDKQNPGLIPGLVAYVNLTSGKVSQVINTNAPLPKSEIEFEDDAAGFTPASQPWRDAGPKSFTRSGSAVAWGPWSFHFAMHPREGLVLNLVKLRDEQGTLRSVLHRASMSEMAVPYGEVEDGWHLRNIFDAGETGMLKYGKTSLTAGVDAPTDADFIDAAVNDETGKAIMVPRAVALFERVAGALWRHREHGVPARELVILSYATIDNYDYGIQWVFAEDGALTVELFLTGIMAAKAAELGIDPYSGRAVCGTRVSSVRVAPNHQHFFNFRLDFDIGQSAGNSVTEIQAGSLPRGPENPTGNAITTVSTVLKTEQEGERLVSVEHSRKWKITGSNLRNELGQLSGFALLPGENALPLATTDSALQQRAGFTTRHIWVTPYAKNERYAAGEYPFNTDGSTDGLKAWTQKNRTVENQDVVLWYTLGVTHLPRVEEWPIMPAHRASFRIVPAGFYSRNPVLAKRSAQTAQ